MLVMKRDLRVVGQGIILSAFTPVNEMITYNPTKIIIPKVNSKDYFGR